MSLARDNKGNRLMAILPPGPPPVDAPMPAALAAVWHGPHLLLVFDRYRHQWELPGGQIDPGETPLEAAIRELHEETGLHLPTLALAAYAHYHLTDRTEYAALYTAEAPTLHQTFTPTPEIAAIHWWHTETEPPTNTQPLDTTLAQQTHPCDPPPGAGLTENREQPSLPPH